LNSIPTVFGVSSVCRYNQKVQVVSLRDYYPFGAVMKGRSYTASGGKYRYGFNGMEQDEDLGEDYTTEYRLYDAGLGRWFSPDPLVYNDETPYSFCSNNPVNLVNPLGLKGGPVVKGGTKVAGNQRTFRYSKSGSGGGGGGAVVGALKAIGNAL
jgi:RHS repeat-associated protein